MAFSKGRPISTLAAALFTVLRQSLTFDHLKNSLILYVAATHLLKGYRHILARGVVQTLDEGRIAILRVGLLQLLDLRYT